MHRQDLAVHIEETLGALTDLVSQGEAGLMPAQLAVLWCKDQPGITALLIGPRTLGHLEDVLPVAEMNLDDSLREACDKLVPPGSTVANFHNTSGWMIGQVV
jgi:aryl-alcohol dehydrogenase-like predicted oxidoreductase